ncbi:MAG: metallophosphoesterase, partial [Candidatus Nanohaloarchaea archaeon]
MQVAIVSDTHFGYQWGNERGEDAFRNAREAFERTVDADLVLLPGDIFDKKVPKQEVLGRAIDCFNTYRNGSTDLSVVEESEVDTAFDGTPVVAIHGTHERRSDGFTNPIELLDKM